MDEFYDHVTSFLDAYDFAPATRRAIRSDIAKFSAHFEYTNHERIAVERITVQDVVGFRDSLIRKQAAATTNRALVSLRRFFDYLVTTDILNANPAADVKQMRLAKSSPKGLDASQARKIMREAELSNDLRASAVLGLMLYAGLRVSEVVGLERMDVTIQPRSGEVTIRHGKGNKERIVPLPSQLRTLICRYLEVRPPSIHEAVFLGERGPLTTDGVRSICSRYAAATGVAFTPHTLRHTFAHNYLAKTQNDLVGLAQILGHESLDTTSIYARRRADDLLIGME